MARQIIVLEKLLNYPTGWRYAMWATVPVARQPFYAKSANWTSAFLNATLLELTELRNGALVERVETYTSTVQQSLAIVRAAVIASFQQFQQEITDRNPWVGYGSSWDGTSWTTVGVS